MSDPALAPNDRQQAGRSSPRRWGRVVVALALAVLVVAYVVYMALGMPGMDHSSGSRGSGVHDGPNPGAVADTTSGTSGRRLGPDSTALTCVDDPSATT